MLVALCIGLYFLLASFGSPLYALFIPVVLLVYLPISWGFSNELDLKKELSSHPTPIRIWLTLPLYMYRLFCLPGFFICKAFGNLKEFKQETSNNRLQAIGDKSPQPDP